VKLAEFFAAIGFKVEGEADLKKVQTSMMNIEHASRALLLRLAAVTAAMGFMTKKALENSDEFRQFAAVTGLSTDELRDWQFMAVQAGVSTGDLTSVIKDLQKARTEIMLGGGDASAWKLLGIAPDENPFTTLQKLKERIKDMDPSAARTVLGKAGISESTFSMLRQMNAANVEFKKLGQNFRILKKEQDALDRTNTAWARIRKEVELLSTKFVGVMAPALEELLGVMEEVVFAVARFVKGLGSDTFAAKAFRIGIIAITGVIVALTAALSALLVVLPIFIGASKVFGVSAARWSARRLGASVAGWAALGAQLLGFAATVYVLVDAYDELMQAFAKTDFVKMLLDKFQWLGDTIDWIAKKLDKAWRVMEKLWTSKDPMATEGHEITPSQSVLDYDPRKGLEQKALAPVGGSTKSSDVEQNNSMVFNLRGGDDPVSTARQISDSLKPALSDATRQLQPFLYA